MIFFFLYFGIRGNCQNFWRSGQNRGLMEKFSDRLSDLKNKKSLVFGDPSLP